MPPVRLTSGAKWATISREGFWWVVRTSAGTARLFLRYRSAEDYVWRVIR